MTWRYVGLYDFLSIFIATVIATSLLRDEKGFPMDKNQAIRIIKRFVKAVKKEGIFVDRVILYGSYARGRIRADSDIDVAVISRNFGKDRTEEGMKLFRIAG